MTRHHIMTSVKNEAIYLLEWVAHHKALGFDQIYIAANDCNDGTPALLRKLDANGFVKFCRNKCPADKIPQHEGYKVLRERFDVDECDWLMTIDVDEFLYVSVGDGSVGALTGEADENVDIIALNSLNFGTGDTPKRGDVVTRRFQHRLAREHPSNRSIKSITRNPSRFMGAHNHSMVRPPADQDLVVLRGDGTTFDIAANTKLWTVLRHLPLDEASHNLAHYNHYSIKSPVEYALRQQRGRGAVAPADDLNIRHSAEYFGKRAAANDLDNRIAKYDQDTGSWMEKMLAIPSIKSVQDEVEDKFFAKVAALIEGDK